MEFDSNQRVKRKVKFKHSIPFMDNCFIYGNNHETIINLNSIICGEVYISISNGIVHNGNLLPNMIYMSYVS
ncbi:hypothetical protein BLOT_002611 [Blomia tropicalis]|nr:hypothetical protein BLOT_002611 [Blomia tropicalis]